MFQISLPCTGLKSGAGEEGMFYFCVMKIILWGLLIYFLYNLILKIVAPASKVGSQMKDKVRDMQQQSPKATEVKQNRDYIEFEEVKE